MGSRIQCSALCSLDSPLDLCTVRPWGRVLRVSRMLPRVLEASLVSLLATTLLAALTLVPIRLLLAPPLRVRPAGLPFRQDRDSSSSTLCWAGMPCPQRFGRLRYVSSSGAPSPDDNMGVATPCPKSRGFSLRRRGRSLLVHQQQLVENHTHYCATDCTPAWSHAAYFFTAHQSKQRTCFSWPCVP